MSSSAIQPTCPDKIIALLLEKNIKRVQTWDHIPGLEDADFN